jgi:hypothetical protein
MNVLFYQCWWLLWGGVLITESIPSGFILLNNDENNWLTGSYLWFNTW